MCFFCFPSLFLARPAFSAFFLASDLLESRSASVIGLFPVVVFGSAVLDPKFGTGSPTTCCCGSEFLGICFWGAECQELALNLGSSRQPGEGQEGRPGQPEDFKISRGA